MKKWIDCFNELKGSKCQCGEEKKPKQTFCLTCFSKLPFIMKTNLYNVTGREYCKAYAWAVEFLNK
jgi:hypothetical protein